MTISGQRVFEWPIDWASPGSGQWSVDLRTTSFGFGRDLDDPRQDWVIKGWEFDVSLRDAEIDSVTEFMDAIRGRANSFWLPGPQLLFRTEDGRAANTFDVYEQGAEAGWQLVPGRYIWASKAGEAGQPARITAVVDNGDGTETVTIEELVAERVSSSSSSSHSSSSSSSTAASVTSSSSNTISSSSSSSSSGESSSSSSSTAASLTSSSSSSSSNSSSSTAASVTSSSSSLSSSSSSSLSSSSSANSSSSGDSSSSSLDITSSSSVPTSSSSSSAFIAIDETWTVRPLALVRLADDVERVEYLAERVVKRRFKVAEVAHEYAAAEAEEPDEPAQPIWLYEFTAAMTDETLTWRYTSHPTDITIEPAADRSSSSSAVDSSSSSSSAEGSSASSSSPSSQSSLSSSSTSSSSGESSSSSSSSTAASETSSNSTEASETSSSSSSGSSSSSSQSPSSSSSQSSSSSVVTYSSSSSSSQSDVATEWLAAAITHSRLTRSAKAGGSVTVTGDYDSIEPLRLLVPLRLPVPVRVRIYKSDVRSYDTELVFDGVVRKPSLAGRAVTAECSEWGEALDQRLPAFYVQPECNYRVFDTATCRAAEATFQKSVTVTSVNGRSAIVSGAGLSGAAASYYAQGRITLGEGAGRQVRFIMESSAADGTQVALTLSEPITTGVPAAATLLPGCDGTAATCQAKFSNLPNFGGHATPRDNLTLVAIRANPTTGGKK